MDSLYYRHAKTGGNYQALGLGFLHLNYGEVLQDNDFIFAVNTGDGPPYIFASHQGESANYRECKLQTSAELSTGERMVMYRSVSDGAYYVRPEAEFNDGRFLVLDNDLKLPHEVYVDPTPAVEAQAAPVTATPEVVDMTPAVASASATVTPSVFVAEIAPPPPVEPVSFYYPASTSPPAPAPEGDTP